MALRNQPYIPLYIQDFLTDEKLMECSAQSTGVYIRIMCIMHKSDEYGVILLKQKDKQTDKQINNFALKLAKFLPYSFDVILSSLNELILEGVLLLDNDKLIQKRMVKDNDISEKRSIAGKKGGDNNKFAQAKYEAKEQANSEYECVIENVNDSVNENDLINNNYKKLPFEKSIPENAKELEEAEYKHMNIDLQKDIAFNEENHSISLKGITYDFETFYANYNNQKDKMKSKDAWNSLTRDEIIICFFRTPVYLNTVTDRKYLYSPLNYLKDRKFMIDYRFKLDSSKYDLNTGLKKAIY